MALNPNQVRFVNEVARPMIEKLIRFRSELDAFVMDYANQQTPLPTNAVSLDDNADGTAPRMDAPTLQGSHVASLNTFCTNMRDTISGATLNTLIQLSVRPVETILRD
jgi:hypothetical protein